MSFRSSSRVLRAAAGVLFLSTLSVRAAEDFTLDGQSLQGHTGYVLVPSVHPLRYKQGSIALHRFTLGLAFGWPREVEWGLSFDLREVTPITPFTRDTFRARAPLVNFHGKYRFLRAEKHGLDLAVGQWRHIPYLLLSPKAILGWKLEGGPSFRRRSDETTRPGHLLALSHTGNYQRAFVDYDSQTNSAGAGWRYLLSDAIRLELMFTQIGRKANKFERFIFGVTIAN